MNIKSLKVIIITLVLMTLLFTSCALSHIEILSAQPEEIVDINNDYPAKVHLKDGSMVIFAKGFRKVGDIIKGDGLHYNITREHVEAVTAIQINDIKEIARYRDKGQPFNSLIFTILNGFIIYGIYYILTNWTG